MLEYLAVSLEHNACAGLGRVADYLELLVIVSAVEFLEVNVLAVLYGKLKPLGKSVDYRSADAVQSSRNLIASAAVSCKLP